MNCHNNHCIRFEFYLDAQCFMFMQDGCISTIQTKRAGTWRWSPSTAKLECHIDSNFICDPTINNVSVFFKKAQKGYEQWLAKEVLS